MYYTRESRAQGPNRIQAMPQAYPSIRCEFKPRLPHRSSLWGLTISNGVRTSANKAELRSPHS